MPKIFVYPCKQSLGRGESVYLCRLSELLGVFLLKLLQPAVCLQRQRWKRGGWWVRDRARECETGMKPNQLGGSECTDTML